MSRGELTRNDAIFVLVATASPATLYLWILISLAVFNKGILPDYLSGETMSKVGQRLLILFSIGSIILWVVVAALVFWLPNSDYFSQPGCDQDYGKGQRLRLLWPVFFLLGLFLVVAVVSVIAWYRRKYMARRGAPSNL